MNDPNDVARATLADVLGKSVLVADGAMGTMLQLRHLTAADFEGQDGCNEILNVTRPDVIREVHDAYLEVGVDCIQTNTFGANWSNLGEYGSADRVAELSEAGARIARAAADGWSRTGQPRFVLGSVGPGSKLPTLGHVAFSTLRDSYQAQVEGLIAGGVDAILVETIQDVLQGKAALVGANRALDTVGTRVPLIAHFTVETTGTMLIGTDTLAALTSLEELGVSMIGLNCATGPAEMSEHLRILSRHSRAHLGVMPNAGLPALGPNGASYPLDAGELADALSGFVRDYGVGMVGGCCGTTPEHLAAVVAAVRGVPVTRRTVEAEPSVSSVFQSFTLRQDASYLSIGERTNANGSKEFREALIAGDFNRCVEIARRQQRDGAHVLDLSVDYVGRDGIADMETIAARLATSTTLPIMLDSVEPAVLQAGLEALGGRCVVNSVNYEDGDGQTSRFARIMRLVEEHGAAVVALVIDEEGQARTAEWKLRVANRLISDLTGKWGMRPGDILVDMLTFPIATGQEETRRDALETIEAIRRLKAQHPDVNTTLGISNVSFGLGAPARQVLNSVFLDECWKAGLGSAIVHASRILPIARIPERQRAAALDLIYDRRASQDGAVPRDPLRAFMELFSDAHSGPGEEDAIDRLADLSLPNRLMIRIVEAIRGGLEEDLEAALEGMDAEDIVNDVLLEAMRTVGDLFASGQMQLPFVLESAETMKSAVAFLEPHIESTGEAGRGRLILATVQGDVHDIGKNLVDIILTNNGYDVVNLGIKQGINAILEAAQSQDADVVGMSGLLVKSTLVMKDNLHEMNRRRLAHHWPVMLGGAALTRAFVEQDLASEFDGEVRYAKDAFEALRLMDAIMAVKRGHPGAALPPPRERRVRPACRVSGAPARTESGLPGSPVEDAERIPEPPFWGTRVVKGIALAEYARFLDERALFRGQWGLKTVGSDHAEPDATGRGATQRLRHWLDRIQTEGIVRPAIVYGYFPAWSEGDRVIVGSAERFAKDRVREAMSEFEFPRQPRDRHLCLADFFRSATNLGEHETDVLALQVVTIGPRASDVEGELFADDQYRDYLELHGLTVQLAEALAEYWHARIRAELRIADSDAGDVAGILKRKYQGERFSFGYPACPALEDQEALFELLDPARIGVSLTESFQILPEQSTSALIFHHPRAAYFRAT